VLESWGSGDGSLCRVGFGVTGGYDGRKRVGAGCEVSFALRLPLLSADDAFHRWVVLGVLAAAGTLLVPLCVTSVGMVRLLRLLPSLSPTHPRKQIIASSLVGSFFVFLGIDLFVNEVDGMSLGLVRFSLLFLSKQAESLLSSATYSTATRHTPLV
jgi:hypothetical protein